MYVYMHEVHMYVYMHDFSPRFFLCPEVWRQMYAYMSLKEPHSLPYSGEHPCSFMQPQTTMSSKAAQSGFCVSSVTSMTSTCCWDISARLSSGWCSSKKKGKE